MSTENRLPFLPFRKEIIKEKHLHETIPSERETHWITNRGVRKRAKLHSVEQRTLPDTMEWYYPHTIDNEKSPSGKMDKSTKHSTAGRDFLYIGTEVEGIHLHLGEGLSYLSICEHLEIRYTRIKVFSIPPDPCHRLEPLALEKLLASNPSSPI